MQCVGKGDVLDIGEPDRDGFDELTVFVVGGAELMELVF